MNLHAAHAPKKTNMLVAWQDCFAVGVSHCLATSFTALGNQVQIDMEFCNCCSCGKTVLPRCLLWREE